MIGFDAVIFDFDGVLLESESFSSVPVQRCVKPSSCVNSISATAFAASPNAADCGVTHATSILQLPAVPISCTVFASSLRSDDGATT